MSVSPAPSRAYDLVILDFDGVLCDSGPWFKANIASMAERHRFRNVGEEELERLRGVSNRAVLKAVGVPLWKLPFIAVDMRARIAADADIIPRFEGVDHFLATLTEAGVRIAIVSSNAEDTIRRILGPANAARVSRYACKASLFGKAGLFRKVVREAGVKPKRVLCVGDESRDVDAARKVGLPCASVTWGYATRAGLVAAGPDHLVDSYADLERLVLG